MLLNKKAKQIQDREDLRAQFFAVFMLGRDSTNYALSIVIHVQKGGLVTNGEFREEVLSVGEEQLSIELPKSSSYP